MSEAERWFKKAEQDFDTAEFNKNHEKFEYAAFLYRQAIEKGLKALMLHRNKAFQKLMIVSFLLKRFQPQKR